MSDNVETPGEAPKFDVTAYPADTLFYDRRTGLERRAARPEPAEGQGGERRAKKERRRRVDPTTFEKQYSPDEIEFMTAMQEFKIRTAKAFPTYAEVLAVAKSLGYRRPPEDFAPDSSDEPEGPTSADLPMTYSFTPPSNGQSH
jgi:hypothetical protein